LLPLGLQDARPLLLVGLLLEGERLEDLRRRGDLDDLDPANADPPLVRHHLHLLLHVGVDALALRQCLVERERADHRPEGGPSQRIDCHVEVGDAEQRLLRIDNLREDRRVHRDDDVVLRDHFLPVAGARDLAHVDVGELLDERRDHDQPGLVGAPVLAEAPDHTDLALLHDVDHPSQGDQQHQHDGGRDGDADDGASTHVLLPSAPSPGPSCGGSGSSPAAGPLDPGNDVPVGQTVSVVPSTEVTTTGVPAAIGSPAPLTASQRSPPRRTWPRSWRLPTTSRVSASWPTRPPCTPRATCPPWCRWKARLMAGRTAVTPTAAMATATAACAPIADGAASATAAAARQPAPTNSR